MNKYNMKTLQDFIFDNIISEGVQIFKLNASNAAIGFKIQDAIRDFIKHSNKRYSFNNKQDLQSFFKDFCTKKSNITKNDLKAFGLYDGKDIAKLIIAKKDELEKDGWNFDAIKSFDETEQQKEYKKWKSSDDYVEGKKFDKDKYKDADEDELTRTLIIYDKNYPGDPDTTLEFDFYGKRSADNMKQVHMLRMEWRYLTGGKYYDAREILLSNYLKKSDAELAKREIALTDDDLTEI